MSRNLNLTNKQYLKILSMIEDKLKTNVNPSVYDNTYTGDKYTTSTIGFCNEDFTTLETALFPDEFKKYNRKSMKYRKSNHACPFDNRVTNPYKKHGSMDLGCGCYYTCGLRRNKSSNENLLELVQNTREKFKNGELDKINIILSESTL